MPERLPRDENGTLLFDKELSEDVEPTWKALEALQREGVIKNIGISNWSIRRIEKLLKVAEIKACAPKLATSL
jgi:diketogulonate reductase-like aldo/keto reductase